MRDHLGRHQHNAQRHASHRAAERHGLQIRPADHVAITSAILGEPMEGIRVIHRGPEQKGASRYRSHVHVDFHGKVLRCVWDRHLKTIVTVYA